MANITQKTANACQPLIPGSGSVATCPLQVVKELQDVVGIQVRQPQSFARSLQLAGKKLQEQPQRVAIGVNGLLATVSLLSQVFTEETLHHLG
jgi:hypothetical protein